MQEKTASKVPQIRFKGFSGEWAEEKMGKLGSFSKGRGYSKSDLTASGTPIVLYGRLYVNYQTAIAEVDTFAEERKGAVKSTGKEVVIPASGETAEDIARASAILSEGIILGGDLNIVYPFDELAPYFLALALSNGKPQADLAKRAQGKTVVHVRKADIESIVITFPKLSEQTQIGEYFRELDSLIGRHQRKHDKLVALKKAMLQKMFPQDGAATPEIRFKGFAGEWVEKRLADICEIVGGGTPSTAIREYWGGDIDWYSPTEIGDDVFATGSVKKITSLGLSQCSARMLPPYKSLLFTSRAGIGDMAILTKEGCTNQGFQSLVLLDDIDPYFIFSMGHLVKAYALKHAAGSTFLEVSSKQLGKMEILVPTEVEQQKIGTYFRTLDKLISKHAIQLQKLQQIKSACLEKMFA